MITTDSRRPHLALSTLSSPAFVPLAEQNPFAPFLPPFWNHLGTYWIKGGMEEGRGFYQKECCLPHNYVIRPFPFIPTCHGPG